jgi:hypothetical protein
MTNLVILNVSGNPLGSLNVSGCSMIEEIYASGASVALTTLDLRGLGTLGLLDFSLSRLSSLNVSGLTGLRSILLQGCQFSQVALESLIDQLWLMRVALGANKCRIVISKNPGSSIVAVTKATQLTALTTAGCSVSNAP